MRLVFFQFCFCLAVTWTVSWPMHRNIRLSPVWTKAMFRAHRACAAPTCRWAVVGSMEAIAKEPLPTPRSPSFPLTFFDTSVAGMGRTRLWEAVWCREGITVSLSFAPSPLQADLSAPPAQPVAQHCSPALIKQRGTAGCVFLGHHSLPWTHCREKAEVSQC